MKARFAIAVLAACAALATGATAASAAPSWNIDLHHGPTNFEPGGEGELWFSYANVGNEETFSPINLEVDLPSGLVLREVRENGWTCSGSPGDQAVACTANESLARHTVRVGAPATNLRVIVDVDPGLSPQTLTASATIEGGGAAEPAEAVEPIEIAAAPAGFGIVPGSFQADFFKSDGVTPERRSGAHPDLAKFSFDLNNVLNPAPGVPTLKFPKENLRDLAVELPQGFVGNPTAVTECKPSELVAEACPRSSQVGRIDLGLEPVGGSIEADRMFDIESFPVFNMTPPRGTVTDLAFNVSENIIHIRASLNPANGYAITTNVDLVNQFLAVYLQKLTLWGVPGDPEHDSERCRAPNQTYEDCPTESSGKAFLTVPSRCDVDHAMRLFGYDSWQQPGLFGSEIVSPMPGRTTDCELPRFEPEIAVNPTSREANAPSGLEVGVVIPQNENPNGLATPPVKSVELSLPEGMTLSPSFAAGLTGCSEGQFGISHAGVPDAAAVACPDSSRIGAVTLGTPLLDKPLEGSLYLAEQGQNPFGSTFAIFLAIHDVEERGVLLKLPGRIDLDPTTGRITSTFDDLPQLPFDEFRLAFRSGQRAPLISPPTCGSHSISAQITSWAQPAAPVGLEGNYQIEQGAKGSACAPSQFSSPFSPQLVAGTQNPSAGRYSPFVFRLQRDDFEQEIGRIETTLPEGLLAKIAGVPYCPEAAIAAISAAEGTGRAELAQPSCPAASRLGSVNTGVGAGNEPAYFPGSAYLAGPYQGAPMSLAIVVPAVAGPYDLGSVVVRAGVFVDPASARVTVKSDPLPTIVHGVRLRLRDVRFDVDREETMLNPTSCDAMRIGTSVFSIASAVANPFNRFQVGNCSRLDYSPKLRLKLSGQTRRSGNPALRAVLTQPASQANSRGVSVILPKHFFIDNAHINNPCTRVQFAANQCPPKSVLGRARAFTPLLGEPLEGPVYFRSNGGERELPDLVVALRGRFDVNLVGFIDSVAAKSGESARLRTRFANLPDAPVTRFVMNLEGGKRGLLENSANLCKVKSRAKVTMDAQSGKRRVVRPLIATACGGKAKKGGPGRRGQASR